MTELLNSSYNYQEPYKYMTNLRCREMEPSITNEYLEYKTFYEEDVKKCQKCTFVNCNITLSYNNLHSSQSLPLTLR
jgi:hypothetical protein